MRLAMTLTDTPPPDVAPIPLEGGWIALPLIAALGGAWAYARPAFTETPAQIAMVLALVVGGWQVAWHALARTDWATPLRQWKGWEKAAPVPALPYQQPDAPGEALRQRLSLARGWWREVGEAALRTPLQRAALALFVSVLLGIALGRFALLLTLCFLALTELATLWSEGKGDASGIWAGMALAGLPWFLGATLAGDDVILPALTALTVALLIGLYERRSWLAVAGPILAAALLIALDLSMAAGWLLLLALPGFIVLSSRPTPSGYRAAIGPWVLGMVALMAWVL